jgi:hypothetical protein
MSPLQRDVGAGECDVNILRHTGHTARDDRDAADDEVMPAMLVEHRCQSFESASDAL